MHEFPNSDEELEFEARKRIELNDSLDADSFDSEPDLALESRFDDDNAVQHELSAASIENCAQSTAGQSRIAPSTKSPQMQSAKVNASTSHLDDGGTRPVSKTLNRQCYVDSVMLTDIEEGLSDDFDLEIAATNTTESGSPLRKKVRRDSPVSLVVNHQFTPQGAAQNYRLTYCEPTLSTVSNLTRSRVDESSLAERDGKKILRRIPTGGYISMTSNLGSRVYCRLRPNDELEQNIFVGHSGGVCDLLQTPYAVLRSQLEKERELKLLSEIDARLDSTDNNNSNRDSTSRSGHLWVERFKPSDYLELLSDDRTNRNLLRWLKQWDKVVFGREVKLRPNKRELVSNARNVKSWNPIKKFRFDGENKSNKGNDNAHSGKKEYEIDIELDKWNRPNQKIALLSGPPGLGKTTLAHIIAKQAGYKAVEMNASDDRSAEAFKNQIEAATQMKSVIGENPCPNCLIIDEIDGAPSAAINVLVSIITSKPDVADATLTKKKRRKRHGLLRRPIICICNDQYASALRPLRSLALLINFPQTLSSRLASRLLEICHHEKLKADLDTMLSLCENQGNDIRSCLSTLQFISDRTKTLEMTDVCSINVGQKDIQRSLFTVWQDIFYLPKQIKRNFSFSQIALGRKEAQPIDGNSLSERSLSSITQSIRCRFRRTLNMAQGFGDYGKVNLGMHANYPTLRYNDRNLNKISCGIDWLCFNDLIDQEIQRGQDYCLMAYLPFASIIFNLLFASAWNDKIQFPTAHYDFIAKLTQSTNIVAAVVSELKLPMIYATPSILVLEILPLLLDVISPIIRQVNMHLYSVAEKTQLRTLIDIMMAYSLVYRQQLGDDGQYTYVLDHPIDLLTTFTNGSSIESRNQLSYATKQLISREIEQEKMKQRDNMMRARSGLKPINVDSAKSCDTFQPHKMTPKFVPDERPMKDFFGRPIVRPKLIPGTTLSSVEKGCDNLPVLKSDIWFHFNEGYSNAVRKNITIESLL